MVELNWTEQAKQHSVYGWMFWAKYSQVLKVLPDIWDYKKNTVRTAHIMACGFSVIDARAIRTLLLENIAKGVIKKPER